MCACVCVCVVCEGEKDWRLCYAAGCVRTSLVAMLNHKSSVSKRTRFKAVLTLPRPRSGVVSGLCDRK